MACNQPCVECGERPCSCGDDTHDYTYVSVNTAPLPEHQGLGADFHDLIAGLINEAIDRPEVEWALVAARAAAEGLRETGMDFEAKRVGPHVLVTVYASHLGRPRRNWASARVVWWDGAGTWEDYVKRSMNEVARQICQKLDARAR